MDQNLIFIMVGYIGTILSVIVFVSKTIGSLANKQQDENEKLAMRIEGYVARIVELEKALAFERGARETLENTLNIERTHWQTMNIEWQKERGDLQRRAVKMEMQLDQQKITIDKLEKRSTDRGQEIATLQETNATLQTERDSLRRENADLVDATKNMTKRLDKQDTERTRLIKERETLDKLRIELTRKLADCEKKEQADKKITDMPQSDEPPQQEKKSA